MPTIAQLPAATTVNATDELPISQSGVTRSATVAELLTGTQPALTLSTGALLGRVSAGAGTPEPVAVGSGLAVTSGSLTVEYGTAAGTAAVGNDPRILAAEQTTNKGQPNGYAALDATGHVPTAQLPPPATGTMIYQGEWDAATNAPALASGQGISGQFYLVSTAGSTVLDGISTWSVGDIAFFNGSNWQRIAASGTGGTSAVSSVFGRIGAVTLEATDVTTALGFTPYSATNPANYIAAAGAPVQSVAGRTGAITLAASDIGGLGSLATQNAAAVAITGGTISGAAISGLPVASSTATGVVAAGGGLTVSPAGTLSVAYGSTADTAAAGNDPRITGALQTSNNLAEIKTAGSTAQTTAQSNLGLGSLATQNAAAVAITGGTISGAAISGLPVASSTATGVVAAGGGLAVSAAGTLSVAYGSTADTAAAGNDPRITGALQTSNNLAEIKTAGSTAQTTAQSNLGLGSLATQNAAAVAITGGSLANVTITGAAFPNIDLSTDNATPALTGANARALSARFADYVNINDFGLARDGVTDDSAKVAAAVTAAAAVGKALYVPIGGPILMAGAAQVTLNAIRIFGDGGLDTGYPYGRTGAQFWITDTARTPFLLGTNITLEDLVFFYPKQVDQPGAPIVYPPLFAPASNGIGYLTMSRVQVTNAYILLQCLPPAGMDIIQMSDCRFCALDTMFDVSTTLNSWYINGCDMTFAQYTSEIDHYYGGGSGATSTVSVATTADAPAGSTTISVASTTGLFPGMYFASGTPSGIPWNATITAVGSGTITISPATGADVPSGSTIKPTYATYYLRNYVNTNHGTWLRITGSNSETQINDVGFGGIGATNCYVFGFRTGIHVRGGNIAGCDFSQCGFDRVGTILLCDQFGTINNLQMTDFVVYGTVTDAPNQPLPLFAIYHPAPSYYPVDNTMLTVDGMDINFATGDVFDIKGANIGYLRIGNCKLTSYGNTNAGGVFRAADIDAPNGTFHFTSNLLSANVGNGGVRLTAIAAANITGNSFQNNGAPIDIETVTSSGGINVSGNVTSWTTGTASLATGLLAGEIGTVGGTVTAGDTLTVTATGSTLPGGSVAYHYTVKSGDTLAAIALALALAVDGSYFQAPVTTSAAGAAGATSIPLSALPVGVALGMAISGAGITTGTTITSIAGGTITISAATSAAIAAGAALVIASSGGVTGAYPNRSEPVVTTALAMSGATTLAVYDTTRLSIGMQLSNATGLPSGVTVVGLTANSVTLSAALTAEIVPNTAIVARTPAHVAGIFATANQSAGVFTCYAPSSAGITWAASVSSGATETLTLASATTTAGANVLVDANAFDKPSYLWTPVHVSYSANAVNGVRSFAASTGNSPGIITAGADANIGYAMFLQGTGTYSFAANNWYQVEIDGLGTIDTIQLRAANGTRNNTIGLAANAADLQISSYYNHNTIIGASGTQGSPAVLQGAQANQSYSIQAPSSGGTITIPNNCDWLQLTPSTTLASLTITLPAAPVNGQRMLIGTTNAITALTLDPGAGQTINGAPTTLATNTAVEFIFVSSTWFRKQ